MKEETKEQPKKEEKIIKSSFELGTIVTQTGVAIINNKTGNALSDQEALVLILNKLEEIQKVVG